VSSPWDPPFVLASASPRRRLLLAEAGIAVEVEPPPLDDAALPATDVPAEWWAMSMAWLKGRAVAERRRATGAARGTILAADTVCRVEGRSLGQPRDAEETRRMLRSFVEGAHDVISGVALLDLAGGARLLFFDRAQVTWGRIASDQVEAYVASGAWRGKAGGYNLAERLRAGWPIEVRGDPATVMGLPIRRLAPLLGGAAGRSAR
jgi:septum formation protein